MHTNAEPAHHAEPEKIPTTTLDFLNLMPFGGDKLDDNDDPQHVPEQKESPWTPVTDADFLSALPYAGVHGEEADELFGSKKDRKEKLAKSRDHLHKERKKQKNKYVSACIICEFCFFFDCYGYSRFTDIPQSIIQILTTQITFCMNRQYHITSQPFPPISI